MDVTRWIESLADEERGRLARLHAATAEKNGAYVTRADGSTVPIPPLLTPEALSPARRETLAADARGLVAAVERVTAWMMSDAGERARALLLRPFTPVEHTGVRRYAEARRLATARVDYFLDEAGEARALEVNATIPAMQGYSDVVAASFLRTVGAARGLSPSQIEALVDANGRNTDDLLASLREHHARLTGHDPPSLAIAIVARAGDAQLGELRHYVARWTALGHRVVLGTPDDATLDDGVLRIAGIVPDVVYRHVFARRLVEGSPFARALAEPARHRILNPLASHLEVKGMLGYASLAGSDEQFADALGLGDDARRAIARSLPWTRLLVDGASRGPDGEQLADLVETVAAEPDRFVLKRSWDYGGKSVFLGLGHDGDLAAMQRAGEALGLPSGTRLSWRGLVCNAAKDARDAWIVQGFVRTRPRRHFVADAQGGAWKDLYVDLSMYTNLLVDARPSGGASRAAPGRIVNILGGGGLAPLIRDEVLARLGA